jgi:probable HAF family extracellular repeat protein
VTGYGNVGANNHAFISNGTMLTDLGTLGGSYSVGVAINDSGQVAGNSTTAAGSQHAFTYGGTLPLIDLGTLGGASSYATGINASGQVVGNSATSAGSTDKGQIVASGIVNATGASHVFVLTPQ